MYERVEQLATLIRLTFFASTPATGRPPNVRIVDPLRHVGAVRNRDAEETGLYDPTSRATLAWMLALVWDRLLTQRATEEAVNLQAFMGDVDWIMPGDETFAEPCPVCGDAY
ncbi:hypothetical protein Q5752_005154 [Cryptotrichosporon argae]